MKQMKKHIAILIAAFALIFTSLPMEAHAVSTPPNIKRFTARALDTTQARLVWDYNSSVSGYAVYVNGKLYKSLSKYSQAYTVPNRKPGTTYSFTVRRYNVYKQTQYYNSKTKKWQAKKPAAKYWRKCPSGTYKGKKTRNVNARKYGKASPVRKVTMPKPATTPKPAATPKPGALTGLKVTKVTTDSITITWNKITSNCTGYILYKNGVKQVTSGPGNTSYTFRNLSPDTSYRLSIKGYCGSGSSAKYSAEVSVTQKTLPKVTPSNPGTDDSNVTPAQISGLTVVETTTDSITVKWDKLTGNCTGYEVDVDGNVVGSPGINTTTFKITGLQENITYLVRVRGYYRTSTNKINYGTRASMYITTNIAGQTPSDPGGNDDPGTNPGGNNPGSGSTTDPAPNLPSGKNTTGGVYDQYPETSYAVGSKKYNAVDWAKKNIPSNASDAQKVILAMNYAMSTPLYGQNCAYDASNVSYILDYVGVPNQIHGCQDDAQYGYDFWYASHMNNLVWINGTPYVIDVMMGHAGYPYANGHLTPNAHSVHLENL